MDEAGIQLRYQVLDSVLDERSRHRFAAAEAKVAGRGGVARHLVVRSTIIRGLAELAVDYGNGHALNVQPSRIWRPGGGRKKLTETDPTLLSDLQGLVEPVTGLSGPHPMLESSPLEPPQPFSNGLLESV